MATHQSFPKYSAEADAQAKREFKRALKAHQRARSRAIATLAALRSAERELYSECISIRDQYSANGLDYYESDQLHLLREDH